MIQEGACGLREQSKSRAGALLAFCINQGISASFLSSIFSAAKFFPCLFLYFCPFRQCCPPEGIPGPNRGWTPVLLETTFSLLKEFLIPKGCAAIHGVAKTGKPLTD